MKHDLFRCKKCGVLSETIGGLFNLGTTALGGWMSDKMADEEREWNAEQSQINRDFQRDERIASQEYNLNMWNLNNEYNSPKAQLERAREAGINPNTLFGDTTPVSSQALRTTPMPGSQASSNIAGSLGSQLIGASSALGINTANMLNTLADRDTKQYWLSYDQMTEEQRKKLLDANLNNILKDVDLKDVNIDTAKVVLGNLAELKEQELLNLREIAKKIQADTRSTESAIERDDNIAEANIAYVEQQTKLSEEQTESAELLNEFTSVVGAPPGTPEYLFVKKLADEKKLTEFLSGAYKPLERARWKPGDYYVTVEDYSDTVYDGAGDITVAGLPFRSKSSTTSRSHRKKTLRYDYSYPQDSTIVNP